MLPAVLHIGMPKTGTSHIQEWLRLNRRQISGAGYHVFHGGRQLAMAAVSNEHLHDRKDFRAAPPQSRNRLERSFSRAVAGTKPLIISSEYFFLADPSLVRRTLQERGVSVSKVICYLRRQDAVSSSGYTQDVKALGMRLIVEGHRYDPALDYSLLVERWKSSFPDAELVVRNYDRIKDNLLHSFTIDAQLVSVRCITPESDSLIDNVSFDSKMTEVARLCNERDIPVNVDGLLRYQANNPNLNFSFSQRVVDQFEAAYISSNRALASHFDRGEFDDFCLPGWKQKGADFSGRLSEAEFREVLSFCREQRPLQAVRTAARFWRNVRYFTKNAFASTVDRASGRN